MTPLAWFTICSEETYALAAAESGEPAIVPGKPKESELLKRVSSTDDSVRMPPEGKPLSAAEIEVLSNWIAGGAEWSKHWSFIGGGGEFISL